jgi:hypothetical protein
MCHICGRSYRCKATWCASGCLYSTNVSTNSRAILVGFGLTFNVNASPLLITELAYPTQVSSYINLPPLSSFFYYFKRGKITSIFNTTWYVGSILCKWGQNGSAIMYLTFPLKRHGYASQPIPKPRHLYGRGRFQP